MNYISENNDRGTEHESICFGPNMWIVLALRSDHSELSNSFPSNDRRWHVLTFCLTSNFEPSK